MKGEKLIFSYEILKIYNFFMLKQKEEFFHIRKKANQNDEF